MAKNHFIEWVSSAAEYEGVERTRMRFVVPLVRRRG
jgi:desulfoferrodoxin (superoxide reductase-like protein)